MDGLNSCFFEGDLGEILPCKSFEFGEKLDKIAFDVVQLLDMEKLQIAVAESCTGGMLAQYLTSVSGASRVFQLGVVSYSECTKISMLDVDKTTISTKGIYSKEVAIEMAFGVMEKSNSDIGIGVTGVASYVDDLPQNRVGTVFVAIVSKNNKEVLFCENLEIFNKFSQLDRDFVRKFTVFETLHLVKRFILK